MDPESTETRADFGDFSRFLRTFQGFLPISSYVSGISPGFFGRISTRKTYLSKVTKTLNESLSTIGTES